MNDSKNYYYLNHGLRTPNGGIIQRSLKFWADVADKICFSLTYKFGIGIPFSSVHWRQFTHRASVVCDLNPPTQFFCWHNIWMVPKVGITLQSSELFWANSLQTTTKFSTCARILLVHRPLHCRWWYYLPPKRYNVNPVKIYFLARCPFVKVRWFQNDFWMSSFETKKMNENISVFLP